MGTQIVEAFLYQALRRPTHARLFPIALLGWRKYLVILRAAIPFLIISTPVTLIAAKLSRHVSNRLSALLLVALLLSASVIFWFRYQVSEKKHDIIRGSLGAVAAGGTAGILGVGAGFVVVPALRLESGLTIAKAVATSSLILALNSITMASSARFGGWCGLSK